MRTREIIREAKLDGARAGANAASWLFDGNTPDSTYEAVLSAMRDGDVMDGFNPPNLSGEWADAPTPSSLAYAYDLADDNDPAGFRLDDACQAWEEAASDAFWAEIERVCLFHVGPSRVGA